MVEICVEKNDTNLEDKPKLTLKWPAQNQNRRFQMSGGRFPDFLPGSTLERQNDAILSRTPSQAGLLMNPQSNPKTCVQETQLW